MSDGTSGRLGSFLQGSAILFIGFIIQMGFGFAARLIIARYLGQVNYGLVNIGKTVMTTMSVIVLLGLDTGIGRYLPRQENPGTRRGVLVSSFTLALPTAILAGGAIAIFASTLATTIFNDPSAEPVIRLFGITIPLMVFVKLTIGSIRGQQEASPRVLLQNLGLPLIRFGLIAVAIALGFGAVGVAGAYTGAYLIIGFGGLYYLHQRTSLFEKATDIVPMRRELLTFSAPLMIVSTMAIVHSNIDIFILGYFQSTRTVGTYTSVYPLADLLRVGLSTFGFLFMPLISELHANGQRKETQRTYQIVSKWVLLATLPVLLVFITYPKLVIQYTFGSEYTSGATALAILAIGFFTHAVSGPSGDTLTAIGKTRLVMIDNVVVAVTNVGLNLLLVPRYSLIGAAVATTVAYVVMNSLYVIQLYTSINTHPLQRSALAPAIGAVIIWFSLNWILDTVITISLPIIFVITTVFAVIYLVLILALGGIESEEVDLLKRFEDRLGVDLSYLRSVAKKFID